MLKRNEYLILENDKVPLLYFLKQLDLDNKCKKPFFMKLLRITNILNAEKTY